MKKTSFIALGCVLLTVCLFMSGCSLFNFGEDDSKTPLATPLSVKYTEYSVIKGDISRTFSGTCEIVSVSYERCNFPQRANGQNFDKYLVKSGQAVKKGDVLCQTREGTQIKSPIDGIVRYTNPSYNTYKKSDVQVNSADTMVIVDPADINNAQALLSVSDGALKGFNMSVGTKVTLTKIGSSGGAKKEAFNETVIGASPKYEISQYMNRNGEIVENARLLAQEFFISIENISDDVKVGDRLSITYVEEESKDTLLVPVSAVYSYNGRSYVYVLDSQGLKKEVYVETGIANDTMIEIKSGLKYGQKIIEY